MSDSTASNHLGKTDIEIPCLGTGAWSWGDKFVWGFGRGYQEEDIRSAFDISIEAGIYFFDTAEVYGQGQSEKFIGHFLSTTKEHTIIATKFMPYPWRWTKQSLITALKNSLNRLGLASVDLYQIHIPLPPVPIETWAEALAEAVEAGLTRAVGVSNFNEDQMRRAYLVLSKRGIPLASNQVEYSLLNRKVETNGLLHACQELGITLIAYSPLAKGLLTGKYSPDNPPPGIRRRYYNHTLLEKIQPLIHQMRQIGRNHDGKTPAQVALNWLICKNTVPIPGAKNSHQAVENAGALGWRLDEREISALDELSQNIQA